MNFEQQKIVNHLSDNSTADILQVWARLTFDFNVMQGWYSDPVTGERVERNVPEMLMLIVSEIAEGMEGYRKTLRDTHLPERPMIEVELADALIRILDLAGYLQLDLGGAFADKFRFNAERADHKLANRAKDGGKKF
jgi:NTP pyrophosphatase (non-canonical NTP hydrolase)